MRPNFWNKGTIKKKSGTFSKKKAVFGGNKWSFCKHFRRLNREELRSSEESAIVGIDRRMSGRAKGGGMNDSAWFRRASGGFCTEYTCSFGRKMRFSCHVILFHALFEKNTLICERFCIKLIIKIV